jgi:hypothetical protein
MRGSTDPAAAASTADHQYTLGRAVGAVAGGVGETEIDSGALRDGEPERARSRPLVLAEHLLPSSGERPCEHCAGRLVVGSEPAGAEPDGDTERGAV